MDDLCVAVMCFSSRAFLQQQKLTNRILYLCTKGRIDPNRNPSFWTRLWRMRRVIAKWTSKKNPGPGHKASLLTGVSPRRQRWLSALLLPRASQKQGLTAQDFEGRPRDHSLALLKKKKQTHPPPKKQKTPPKPQIPPPHSLISRTCYTHRETFNCIF